MKGNVKFITIVNFCEKDTIDPLKINEYIRCRISFLYDHAVFGCGGKINLLILLFGMQKSLEQFYLKEV